MISDGNKAFAFLIFAKVDKKNLKFDRQRKNPLTTNINLFSCLTENEWKTYPKTEEIKVNKSKCHNHNWVQWNDKRKKLTKKIEFTICKPQAARIDHSRNKLTLSFYVGNVKKSSRRSVVFFSCSVSPAKICELFMPFFSVNHSINLFPMVKIL